jgi:hypothetical protein
MHIVSYRLVSDMPCARVQMEAQGELVLKQRDIMMALTKRLSDRDEQILILQEELDAYDAVQRRLEDALDQRTAEVLALRKAALEQARHLQSFYFYLGRQSK